MNETFSEQSFSRLFEGIQLTHSNAVDVVRRLVELTFVEARFFRHVKVYERSKHRVRQCLSLLEDQAIPKQVEKQINVEMSALGRRLGTSGEVEFRCWTERGTMTRSLPFSAFSRETKRLIFKYLSEPLRAEIYKIQDMAVPEAVANLCKMLDELARHCDAKDCLANPDRIRFLKASLVMAKARCDDLKAHLKRFSPEEDALPLENRLRKAQEEASKLASELQKLLQATSGR
jgi:hypothetical protein